ncbi:MAG: hypothetical protein ACLRZ2_01140 [Veillonella sp.]
MTIESFVVEVSLWKYLYSSARACGGDVAKLIETIIALGGDRIVAGMGSDRKYVRPEYREVYDKIS